MEDEVTPSTITRRAALTRIGVGAAVVWSAPAILSFDASAFAGSAPGCDPRTKCAPFACATTLVPCATAPPNPQLPQCFCSGTTEGNCFCWNDFFCNTSACGASTDCPPGYACVATCCGTTCAPPCGAPLPAGIRKAPTTARASGLK